ncbi:hypothetical protein L3Q82_017951 [Scortum barcoo]|uniref:Uncharacterized protein n=1 Tax=Scortum barcoo TaxID=214431 RepID=A0ACB8VKL3_9TELE|nr:hypothetical protein L3Q82_017951 [Scortum barcoo]
MQLKRNSVFSLQLYDSVPMIRNLLLPFMKAFKNIERPQTCKKLATRQIEHKETRVPGQPQDFLDCCLDELDERGDSGLSFCEDRLVMLVLDLHVAGTDTTSNTLLTGFLYLMTYPHIQKRCQQEIDRVLDKKDHAVIHEVQRIANTVPLSVYHSTTNDTKLSGYFLPRATLIIQNLNSVLNEEGQWKFPHEFNPENFLNDRGEFVKPEAFMPFCAGMRVQTPFIFFNRGSGSHGALTHHGDSAEEVRVIWPEDAGQADYTPVYVVTLSPKPYRMKVQLRATQ